MPARASELNQVFTNLVVNELDAIAGAGTLTLRTRRDGDAVIVDVADTGPGVPDDVAPARLRAVLHHEARRGRHGARAGHLPPHRHPARRHARALRRPGPTTFRVRLPSVRT